MAIQEEKILQAVSIMNEFAVDMWITLVRESETNPDPVLELILGKNVTWLSAFMLTRAGDRIAIIGSLDEPNVRSAGLYTTIRPYVESLEKDLLEAIERVDPETIALNYSTSDVLADGLSHGAYLILTEYLSDTPYLDRITSSGKLISALRGRKSPEELERIGNAISITEEILSQLTDVIRPGLTEKDVADFITESVRKRGLEPAWDPEYCPSVFTGPESVGAHYGPTNRKIEAGHIPNVDFGVRHLNYCSDMQWTWYIARGWE